LYNASWDPWGMGHARKSVRTAGILAMIWIGHLQNTSQKHYRLSSVAWWMLWIR
jgi:hypothetical protein